MTVFRFTAQQSAGVKIFKENEMENLLKEVDAVRAIMFDLETMDNRPTSAITAIGAVVFTKYDVIETFYTPVDLSTSVEAGLTMSPETVKWWLNQSPEARKIYDESKGKPLGLPMVLRLLAKFVKESNAKFFFGNGADFDNVILRTAYEATNEPLPWKYYQNMCFRTMKTLFDLPLKPHREGVHHNALDDALFQVKWLQEIISAHDLKIM